MKELQLDEAYELAKELFVEYCKFRRDTENGAKLADGYNVQRGIYQPNIRDLFIDEDLIQLGGTEFIKDCLEMVGVQKENIEKQYINTEEKPTILNIQDNNPRFDQRLISRVDNHMSWSIFKNDGINTLNEDEQKLFEAAEKQEDFWKKHLWKGELKTLKFIDSTALILGLVTTFGFGTTGWTLAALIITPIGAGTVFIAPMVERKVD